MKEKNDELKVNPISHSSAPIYFMVQKLYERKKGFALDLRSSVRVEDSRCNDELYEPYGDMDIASEWKYSGYTG